MEVFLVTSNGMVFRTVPCSLKVSVPANSHYYETTIKTPTEPSNASVRTNILPRGGGVGAKNQIERLRKCRDRPCVVVSTVSVQAHFKSHTFLDMDTDTEWSLN